MLKTLLCRADCLGLLDELKVAYKLYEHRPVLNMEEMAAEVKLDKSPLIKNLFYSDKKSGQFFFVMARIDTKPDKGFWKTVGTTHNNTRFAKEDQIQAILKSKPGSVNPFSLFNDDTHKVKQLLIDEKLYESDFWAFHPMDNTATVELHRDQFLKMIENFKVPIARIDLLQPLPAAPEAEQAPPGQQKKKEEVNLLGLEAKKSQDFSHWYQDVIIKSGLIDYYDVSGCYILRPWAYSIWEKIQHFFDALIKENGVENAYFPMFVSKRALEIEKDHVEGFAPEVAWVTKSGKSDLAEHIAIRPTSETIMYPAYANWIKSHRDLPLKLNQWTNIVRWEFKHPTPFIRTREFLWQEGHTAHATFEEAEKQMFANLQFYRMVYADVLAVPVIKGMKSESQKFPGGFRTSTVETWIPENGRAIQAATSHNLGQNFAKMFKIEFEDEKKEKKMVWQTSWGLTTRSLGIMVMFHGDDKGLVLPPRAAKTQVVVIPVPFKGKEELVIQEADKIASALKAVNVRVHVDARDNYNPGWKYNHWELKGVPIRIEIGPKDIEQQSTVCVVRHSGEKIKIGLKDLAIQIPRLLEAIHHAMFQRATERMQAKTKTALSWPEFMTHLNTRNVVYTPWCNSRKCEEQVKERSGVQTQESTSEGENKLTGQAKSLCIPLEGKDPAGHKCFHCAQIATAWVYWGRSY